MPKELLMERMHFVNGLVPVADAFAGTAATDVVNMENFSHVTFVMQLGVGTTGTSTITVEACDDTTPTNTSAVAFYYREVTTGDTTSAPTACASTGFTTTAGSNKLVIVECNDDMLSASEYGYVRMKMVEVANDPVLGGVLIILSGSRYAQSAQATAIT